MSKHPEYGTLRFVLTNETDEVPKEIHFKHCVNTDTMELMTQIKPTNTFLFFSRKVNSFQNSLFNAQYFKALKERIN